MSIQNCISTSLQRAKCIPRYNIKGRGLHYYRDGYYVSRGVLSLPLASFLFSLEWPRLAPSRSLSPPTLSFHLPAPLSGNTLTVACKESGHCANSRCLRDFLKKMREFKAIIPSAFQIHVLLTPSIGIIFLL